MATYETAQESLHVVSDFSYRLQCYLKMQIPILDDIMLFNIYFDHVLELLAWAKRLKTQLKKFDTRMRS